MPLWIHHWRYATPEARCARANECGRIVGIYGDQIQWPCAAREDRVMPPIDEGYEPTVLEGSPGTAGAFSRLAEGLALAAYQPGGVTAFGGHWEARTARRWR